MKRILYIARNELYSLYYSPIAWLLMALFLYQTSSGYLSTTEFFLGNLIRGGSDLAIVHDLTNTMTVHPMFGYFGSVIGNLFMVFPLICMGLISREVSSGTIKLLYSSPLRIWEIVLGKFLAIVSFTLTLLLLVCVTLVGFTLEINHPDFGQLFFSLFGIFLVLCTYAAIGLFISSLTSYQVVAAIATLVVLGLLRNIGDVWQDIDVLQHITYYLNINAKATNLVRGFINLRDLCYFLVLITGFLSFTVIRIKSGMESVSRFKKFRRYMAVVAIGAVIGYFTSRPGVNAYFDATRNKLYTITPPTQAMLAKLNDGPLELTIYCNLMESGGFSELAPDRKNRVITQIWEPYIRFKPDIHINWVYYYGIDSNDYHYKNNPGKTLRELAEQDANSYDFNIDRFLPPEEVSKQVDIRGENFRSFYQLAYKGKKVILRNFDDPIFFPTEDEISAALNRLIAVPPKVLFLDGEIERGPFSKRTRDYQGLTYNLKSRHSLLNQGYDFDTSSLSGRSIPQDIAALVIADPRTPLSPEKISRINDYIAAGGNLLLFTEPDRRAIIQPVLDKIGLSLRNGLMIQPNARFSSDFVLTYMTDTAMNLAPQFRRFIDNEHKYFGDDTFRVAMGGASAMEYKEQDGWHIEPLLYTDAALSWNRVAPVNPDSLNLKVLRLPGDEKGPFVTAVRMHRPINGKEQRIIAVSDADYLSGSLPAGEEPRRYNGYFGFWCFSWFSYGQFPANTMRPEGIDNKLKIRMEDLPYQETILLYVIPALIAVLGTILLIRRKRK